MEGENIQQTPSRQGQEPIIIIEDEKVEVEIREVLRIHAKDFEALKNSFTEWARQWQ